MLHVQRVADVELLASLADEWNCLTRGIPFRSWQWLLSWWDHFSSGRELFVLTVRDDRRSLVGIAPWYCESEAARGRVLRFLGSGITCTDYLTLLSTHEHEDAVAQAVARWLADAACAHQNGRHDRWDLLDLNGISETDSAIERLADYLGRQGCAVHRRRDQRAWRLPLPGSWDSFVAGFSKNRAKRARRLRRQIDENKQFAVRLVKDQEDLDRALHILIDLHQRRRQSLGAPGCFADERFTGFLKDAASRLCQDRQLQIRWLEMKHKPVAVDVNLVTPEATYSYQSGVDPAALDHSPGHMLFMAQIQAAIEEGQYVYDLLRGDESYKADWGAEPESLIRLRVVPRRAVPQFRHGVWLAGVTMRSWLKSGLTRIAHRRPARDVGITN